MCSSYIADLSSRAWRPGLNRAHLHGGGGAVPSGSTSRASSSRGTDRTSCASRAGRTCGTRSAGGTGRTSGPHWSWNPLGTGCTGCTIRSGNSLRTGGASGTRRRRTGRTGWRARGGTGRWRTRRWRAGRRTAGSVGWPTFSVEIRNYAALAPTVSVGNKILFHNRSFGIMMFLIFTVAVPHPILCRSVVLCPSRPLHRSRFLS